MDLSDFIRQYTDAVYHGRDPEAAGRFIADPCIRHEHGHRVVMSLAENKARIARLFEQNGDLRFEYVALVADEELCAAAYQFSVVANSTETTGSGIEIFRVRGGKIVETWNSMVGKGPWG